MSKKFAVQVERSRPRNHTVRVLVQLTGAGRHQKSERALRAAQKRALRAGLWD